jgi:hypothetical protein
MVLANGTTTGNAELIAPERRFGNTIGIIKEIVGVKRAIAQKLINGTMELIRS